MLDQLVDQYQKQSSPHRVEVLASRNIHFIFSSIQTFEEQDMGGSFLCLALAFNLDISSKGWMNSD